MQPGNDASSLSNASPAIGAFPGDVSPQNEPLSGDGLMRRVGAFFSGERRHGYTLVDLEEHEHGHDDLAHEEHTRDEHAHAHASPSTPGAHFSLGPPWRDEHAHAHASASTPGSQFLLPPPWSRSPVATPAFATRRAAWLSLGLLALCVLLYLDRFVIRPPYGLVAWHELANGGVRSEQGPSFGRSPPQCGWDYEASWKIGLASGASPLTFDLLTPETPTLTCAAITHIPASFVAEPFLFIPSNHLPLEANNQAQAQQTPASASVPSLFHQPNKQLCDLRLSDPVSADNIARLTTKGEARRWAWGGVPGATDTCYSDMHNVRRGATFHPRSGAARPAQGGDVPPADPWYLFYNVKHLGTRKGELGASVSFDHGASWSNLGTVLREVYSDSAGPEKAGKIVHLSYPQVFLAQGKQLSGPAHEKSAEEVAQFVMIPETNELDEVRLYVTDACCFPFGWRLHSTKLRGQRFLSPSPVWSAREGRWFIFTTVGYTLHLYMTVGPVRHSLLDAPWAAHPASPLYTRDRRFGRGAGRVVPWDGGFIRPSQDGSQMHGQQVHLMKVTKLNAFEYEEHWLRSVKPRVVAENHRSLFGGSGAQGLLGSSDAGVLPSNFLTERLHHMDAHFIPAHEEALPVPSVLSASSAGGALTRSVPARWVLVLDGDDHPDGYHFWLREGWWFNGLKSLLLLCVVVFTLVYTWKRGVTRHYVLHPAQRAWITTKARVGVKAVSLGRILRRFYMVAIFGASSDAQLATVLPIGAELAGLAAWRFARLLVVGLVSLLVAVAMTSLYPFSLECGSDTHSGYELRMTPSLGYAALSHQSPAYFEAHLWTQGIAAKLDRPALPRVELPPQGASSTPRAKPDGSAVPMAEGVEEPAERLMRAALAAPSPRDQLGKPIVEDPQAHVVTTLSVSAASTNAGAGATSTALVPELVSRPPRLFIVTSATSVQFDRVRNLLGSLHFWSSALHRAQPVWRSAGNAARSAAAAAGADKDAQLIFPFEVLLYDFNVTAAQRSELQCVRYVRVVSLDHTAWPAHVRLHGAAGNDGVAPMLLEALQSRSTEFGVRDGDAVLYVSPEMEVRSSLAQLSKRLFARGHFSTVAPAVASGDRAGTGALNRAKQFGSGRVQPSQADRQAAAHSVGARVHSGTLAHLRADPGRLREAPMCSADVLGFVKLPTSSAPRAPASTVLADVAACLSQLDCIAPAGSTARQRDPSMLWSTVLHKHGLGCELAPDSVAYAFGDTTLLYPDPTLPTLLPRARPKDSAERARSSMDGTAVVLAYRNDALDWPYLPRLLQQERNAAGQCMDMSSPDGWVARPLPPLSPSAATVSADWFVAASPRAPEGTASRWSYSRTQDALNDAMERALKCMRGDAKTAPPSCDTEVAAHRKALAEHLQAMAAASSTPRTLPESVSSTLRQRSSCVSFWVFLFAFVPVGLSSRVRRALVGSKLRIGMLVFVLCVMFVWVPLYRLALNRWGTFAPWNAMIYTEPYKPPTNSGTAALTPEQIVSAVDLNVDALHSAQPAFAISTQALKLPFPTAATAGSSKAAASPWRAPTAAELFAGPPPGWRPPQRVVVSFTTMPHHVDKLQPTIDSLLAQSLLPDAIYLNLPLGRNKRTNQSYEVLPYLEEYMKTTPFRILRCADVGPLTKLVPTLLAEPAPDTFVITVDSDKVYHPDTIATLVWRAAHDPQAAFGLCGWSFYWQPSPMEVVPVYVPWLLRGTLGRSVDVLQACCGNVYRRAFFPDVELLRRPHKKCFTTDDLWIAAYLANRAHVKRVLINTPTAWSTAYGSLEPQSAPWKGEDPAQWQLSSFNGKEGVDMGCIRGAEEVLGSWRMLRQIENDIDAKEQQETSRETAE